MHSTAALTALRGIYAPVLTPFDSDLRPDAVRFVAHCQWLVRHGARLAVFGTNSEAASIPVDERLRLTDAVLEAGVPPDRLLPGTGSCALGDAVTLTRHADRAGVAGVLVLPPFYYKPASDDGLFAFYAELIERVGSARLRLLLYHIPQLTGVPISTALIERLRARYPDTVVGLKDSSGDWSYSQALLERFGPDGFAVFPASESLLSRGLALGAGGCISATVNLNPHGIRALFDGWDGPQGAALRAQADAVRQAVQALPMIAAMKQVLARARADSDWERLCPPLVPLEPARTAALLQALRAQGFAMPGLGALA